MKNVAGKRHPALREARRRFPDGNRFSPGHRCWLVGLLIALGCILQGFSATAAETASDDLTTALLNNGEDITNPVNQAQVRLQAKTLPDATEDHRTYTNVNSETVTLRSDWVLFSKPDQLALRIDVPWVWSNKPGSTNKYGSTQSDVGDMLMQAVYVRTFDSRWAAAAGAQFIIPTASNDACGAGKWQIAPTVGVRASLPEISAGSFLGVALRQFISVAGDGNTSRSNVAYTSIQPNLNIALPDQWFLNSNPNIKCSSSTGKWFVPLDLMVGKKFGVHWIVSVECQYRLIAGYPQYNEWIEARLGYFF